MVFAALSAAMLPFMVMHLGLTTAMLVTATGRYERLVSHCIHLRQLIEEGNHAPDVFIPHALAPSRHAGGFDTVFDHPECGRRITIDTDLGQVWGRWIKRLAQLCFRYARCQMAANTHGVVVPCPCANEGRVIQVGNLNILRAHPDRAITGHRQKGMHSRKVRIVGPHIDQPKIRSSQDCCTTDNTRCH